MISDVGLKCSPLRLHQAVWSNCLVNMMMGIHIHSFTSVKNTLTKRAGFGRLVMFLEVTIVVTCVIDGLQVPFRFHGNIGTFSLDASEQRYIVDQPVGTISMLVNCQASRQCIQITMGCQEALLMVALVYWTQK